MHALLPPVLLVAALFQPVAGVVFVLDGVLIGAGDGRYLAWAGIAVLVAFAPLAWAGTVLPHRWGAQLALGGLRGRLHREPRGPAAPPRPRGRLDGHRRHRPALSRRHDRRLRRVTPLQSIAMGLVVVLVNATFSGYDAVADPLGWVLVLVGLLRLRGDLDGSRLLLGTAAVCFAVSVATFPPAVRDRLTDSGGWALSLPQLALSFLLCAALAPRAGDLAGRFRSLRWVFAVLAVAPVVVLGGGVDALAGVLGLVSVAALAYLAYLLFRLRVPAAPQPA